MASRVRTREHTALQFGATVQPAKNLEFDIFRNAAFELENAIPQFQNQQKRYTKHLIPVKPVHNVIENQNRVF